MRKVIVSEVMSLDGHFTGPEGDVMVMPFDGGFSENNAELLHGAGTMLLGARSYVGFRDYWPSIKDDPNQPELEREISRLNSAVEKVVISDTLTDADTGPWTDTTRIVSRAQAHDVVQALRDEDEGGDVVVFGSHVLWNDLFAHGLVDEFVLMFGPGVVGAGGVPAFEASEPARFHLLDVHRYDDSDLVRLHYAVQPTTETT